MIKKVKLCVYEDLHYMDWRCFEHKSPGAPKKFFLMTCACQFVDRRTELSGTLIVSCFLVRMTYLFSQEKTINVCANRYADFSQNADSVRATSHCIRKKLKLIFFRLSLNYSCVNLTEHHNCVMWHFSYL